MNERVVGKRGVPAADTSSALHACSRPLTCTTHHSWPHRTDHIVMALKLSEHVDSSRSVALRRHPALTVRAGERLRYGTWERVIHC